MAMSALEKFGQELDNIAAEYEAGFAGKPRNTRNPDNLTKLIGRTRDLLARIDAFPAPGDEAGKADHKRLHEAVAGNLQIYEAEKVAVLEAKAAGPDFEEMAELSTHANFVFARYLRHFAGQSRATRDLGLMGEMLDELEAVEKGMIEIVARQPQSSMKNDLAVVQKNLQMYRLERGEIEKAQNPTEPDTLASTLANLANGQIKLYRDHFAGRSRLSRRPGLLQRMIGGLERIHAAMLGLRVRGFSAEYNEKNIAVVESSLRMYQSELVEVRKVRQEASLEQLMAALGEEANKHFEEYSKNFANKDRRTVDRQLLSDICDRLGEIRRQMRDLARAKADDDNDRNLEIVGEQLGLFEHEYDLIRQAQQPPPS